MKPALRTVLAALAALGILSSAAGQSLNLSHDLVALGIANRNLSPNDPTLDARPLIEAGTQYAFNHAIPLVTTDKGSYYLLTASQSNAVVLFDQLANMTVDLGGSTLYFAGPLLPNGIVVQHCNNFTLTNFQTDFLDPPYTHVSLASVDALHRRLAYQTLPGWPDPASFNSVTVPFGAQIEGIWLALFRDGSIIPRTSRTLLAPGPIQGNILTLDAQVTPWTQSDVLSTLRPGDTVVVTVRAGGPPLLVWESDSITLSNIAIYGSPTWAVSVYATSNSTVDGVRVMPRPGTGLVGSNADGIHFTSLRQNNHLSNSYVTRTLDDGLIMENQHVGLVVAKTGPRQLTVTRGGFLRFPNGTAVNFVDPATTAEIPGATIVSQIPPETPILEYNGQVDLTFDVDVPAVTAGMAMVYAAPAMRGQGSTIEDSVVEDTVGGKGIWVSGAQGVTAARNVARRTGWGGIVVSQLTDPGYVIGFGPPAHDITIRDNVVEGAPAPAGGENTREALASIEVVSTNNQQFGFASTASNTNISIVDNTILDSGRSGIWVGEVNGGTIARNRILGHNRHPELPIAGIPSPFLAQVQSDFAVPLVVRYSSGVTKQDNVIHPTGGLRDVNGEGRSDLAWRNTATGATALWLMNGTSNSAAATIFSNPGWQVTHTGDLNADGRTDLVWRSAGGATAVWLQDGMATKSAATLLGDPNWSVLRTADLDGDAKSDLIWRNNATGQIAAWLMDGTTPTSSAILFGDPNWVVTHTGDFNGDGRMDLVWRNNATGATAIWLMNGLSPLSAGVVFTSLDWSVTHVGDFDGDGKDDLLWHNATTGQTAIWLMNGLAASSSASLLTSLQWAVTLVGDFNGDGKADLTWHNSVTGQTAIWLQNGTATIGSAIVLSDPNWTVTHTGDFNGDGKADLAWRNSSTGATAIWLMNGTAAIGSAIELADPNWILSPAEGL